ncbi:Hypothetical protein CAP_2048 [Chondromyces apiculatus DSM 436]|uniref:Uncharacterized protein n=2 Tax=Chondromyces apiculatus TaxID=51 RepID=A0A017STQ0_9BACT|nr:Hypothetical protein CAP_2048 [Chondromyces apiculatus DSM 436]
MPAAALGQVASPEDFQHVPILFKEYAASTGFSPSFQVSSSAPSSTGEASAGDSRVSSPG